MLSGSWCFFLLKALVTGQQPSVSSAAREPKLSIICTLLLVIYKMYHLKPWPFNQDLLKSHLPQQQQRKPLKLSVRASVLFFFVKWRGNCIRLPCPLDVSCFYFNTCPGPYKARDGGVSPKRKWWEEVAFGLNLCSSLCRFMTHFVWVELLRFTHLSQTNRTEQV